MEPEEWTEQAVWARQLVLEAEEVHLFLAGLAVLEEVPGAERVGREEHGAEERGTRILVEEEEARVEEAV